MRKIRRKKRNKDKEELGQKGRVRPDSAPRRPVAPQMAAPLSRNALMRLQATHGNHFVQRMVAQREAAAQGAAAQGAAAQEEPERLNQKVELDAKTTLNEDGEMEMDLSQLLDLRKFGSEVQSFAEQIEGWGAFGQFLFDDTVKHPFLEMEAAESGKVKFEMAPVFVKQVAGILAGQAMQDEPDLKDFCGAKGLKVTASLHYNLEDPEIKETKLDIPAEMRSGGRKFLPHPVLLLTFEGEIQPLSGGKGVQMGGAALFQAELKEAPQMASGEEG